MFRILKIDVLRRVFFEKIFRDRTFSWRFLCIYFTLETHAKLEAFFT